MKSFLLSLIGILGFSGLFAQEGVYSSLNKAQKERYWISQSAKTGWIIKTATGSKWTDIKVVSFANNVFTVEDETGNSYAISFKKGNGSITNPDKIIFRKDNTSYTLVWNSAKP